MQIISNNDLRTILLKHGIDMRHVYAADATYALVSPKWVEKTFFPWWRSLRFAFGLTSWERKNDCDNFARAAAAAMHDCHALTEEGEADAPAAGEVWYITKEGTGHAINVIITADQGLLFFEPQSGAQKKLTEGEIKSCYYVRF